MLSYRGQVVKSTAGRSSVGSISSRAMKTGAWEILPFKRAALFGETHARPLALCAQKPLLLKLDPLSDVVRPSFSSKATMQDTSRYDGGHTDRALAAWLFLSAGLVFGVVVLGGVTRLTESGLSMVDWSLLHFQPPSTDAAWLEYFEKYKASPEYVL